jgi:hypothetical protein
MLMGSEASGFFSSEEAMTLRALLPAEEAASREKPGTAARSVWL